MISSARVVAVAIVLGGCNAATAFAAIWLLGHQVEPQTWWIAASLLAGFAFAGGVLTTAVAVWMLRRRLEREPVAADAVRIAVLSGCLFTAVVGLLSLSPVGLSLSVIGTALLVLIAHLVLTRGLTPRA